MNEPQKQPVMIDGERMMEHIRSLRDGVTGGGVYGDGFRRGLHIALQLIGYAVDLRRISQDDLEKARRRFGELEVAEAMARGE